MNAHPPRVGDVITTAEQLDTLWHLEEVLIDASGHYPSGGTFDRCWTRPVPASVGGIHGMWEVLVYGASMPDSLTTTERIRIATVLYLPGAETLTEAAPCRCRKWQTYLGTYDSDGYTLRCHGCLRAIARCTCG